MNLIAFGFNEKGTPVFLNEEPYQQVGTMYLMKAGENKIVGITLDDKLIKLASAPGKVKRGRKPKVEVAEVIPRVRGRKAKASEAAPKKRGRKPAPKSAKETVWKKTKVEKKSEDVTVKA